MKQFKKHFYLGGLPADVYNALVNQAMVEIWSGEPAVMSEEPGSEFSLWDGSITGRNLEFEKDHRIVQEWNFGEQDEPSLVTLKLHPKGKGTQLEVLHTNIPDDAYDNIVEGWISDYLGGLEQLFEA